MLKFHNKLRQKNTTSVQVHSKRQKAVFKKKIKGRKEKVIFSWPAWARKINHKMK